jgi:hypothetical protein
MQSIYPILYWYGLEESKILTALNLKTAII